MSTRVVVIGQGYVGLPLAMRAVEVGHDVIGIDLDASRIERLAQGRVICRGHRRRRGRRGIGVGPVRRLDRRRIRRRFRCGRGHRPDPLREGAPDLTYIETAMASLAPWVRPGVCVILESTTYPGTTEELVGPILAEASGLIPGVDFDLGYSPERIDPGNPTWGFVNTPKVVSGVSAQSLVAVQGFYDTLVNKTVPVSSPKEAELVKLLENTFRHVNIALVNELAVFAGDLGIDVWRAIDAAASKPFGFMRFSPGPGVGGHCLPVDPSYLSWRVRNHLGHSFRFVELANDVNDHMPDYVVRRLTAGLNRDRRAVNGSRILLLGLAYKRNTGDARESPSVAVADRLLALGAEVVAADPMVSELHVDPRVVLVEPTRTEVERADAVIVLTDHDAFDLSEVGRVARYVLDTRHAVPASPNVEYL